MSPGEVTSKCRLTRRARGRSSRQRAQQRQTPGAGFEKPSVGEAKADGAAESGSCTLGGHRRDVSFLYGGHCRVTTGFWTEKGCPWGKG